MNKYASMASSLYTSIATFVEFSFVKVAIFLFCGIIPSWLGVFQHVVVDESANVPFYWGVELHISNSSVLNCVIYDRSATLQKACTCSPYI
jgi:hypothetical protein